jgi:hypothetical protein
MGFGWDDGGRYLSQVWEDGTICDKTGIPRSVEVQVSKDGVCGILGAAVLTSSLGLTVPLQHPNHRPNRSNSRDGQFVLSSVSLTLSNSLLTHSHSESLPLRHDHPHPTPLQRGRLPRRSRLVGRALQHHRMSTRRLQAALLRRPTSTHRNRYSHRTTNAHRRAPRRRPSCARRTASCGGGRIVRRVDGDGGCSYAHV